MQKTIGRVAIMTAVFLLGCGAGTFAEAARPYFFPYVNPYEATVMEAPPPYQATLPENIPTSIHRLKIFPERRIPSVFWYQKDLAFSLVSQKKRAALIFIVAGTGARYDSPKMLNLQRIFYQAGFHVVSISSPTHMDFIIHASSTMVPGHLHYDAQDLYRAMVLAWQKVKNKVEVSSFHLTGYSLGGSQAAFVAQLDEQEKVFNFEKVLLINPPLHLFNSVQLLDRLVSENLPSGPGFFSVFFEVMEKLAEVDPAAGYLQFSQENLYRVHKEFPPTQEFLASLIGLAFRLDLANMMFTSDVMTRSGYIVPKDATLTSTTPLMRYAMVSYRTSFADYFHDYLYPYFRRTDPGLTEQEFLGKHSLKSIAPYLRRAEKIGLMHNEDDIIMAPGEVEYLSELFGRRAKIYPTGGHCGNMVDPDVVLFLQRYFTAEE